MPTPTSFLTPEFLTQKLNLLDQVLQKVVAPIMKFSQMLQQNAPPAVTGVQGGERRVSKGLKNDNKREGIGKTNEDAKVVGKVLTSQIPISLPIHTDSISTTIVTTKPLARPIVKGIVIGSST